eukprot:gene17101-20370_t
MDTEEVSLSVCDEDHYVARGPNESGWVYCPKCEAFMCNDCNLETHIDLPRTHKPQTITLPIEVYEKHSKHINYEATDEERSEDHLNRFIHVGKIDKDTYNIMTGSMWTDTGIADGKDFMMVSFFGPSGAGKSTLMRSLFPTTDNRLPIPGSPDSTMSTSRDINAFKATITDNDNVERNYIMVDTEGIGGGQQTVIKGLNNGADDKERLQFVNTTYPRLLYLFSNVFVFVFDASLKQKGTIANYLIHYAYTGASKSANQFLRPHLVLIINKAKGNPELEVSKSTKAFLVDEVTEPLKVLFQSINVINIPENSNTFAYTNQVIELEKLIRGKLIHSSESKGIARLNNTREFIMKNMSAAISKFSHSPDAFIDFFDLEACFQPVGKSLSDFIHMYFVVAYNQYEKNRSSWNPRLDYNLAIESTRHRVIKYYQDHKKLHAITEEFTKSLRQAIKDALVHIEKWAPCGYKFESGSYCSFKRHTHGDIHQSHDTYKASMWTGYIHHRIEGEFIAHTPAPASLVDIDFNNEPPKSAGYRLLSLCGGGIRGVVECVILKEIQTLVHDIPIVKLFDLIVGTSTGGLVALALATNNYTPEKGIEMFETLGKVVFVGKFGTNLPIKIGFAVSILYSVFGSLYDRKELHNALAEVIPDTSLIESSKDVKVAVPSVTTENGRFNIRLFGSYNRQEHSDYQLDFSSSCIDASEATSAAGGYFPPFKSDQGIVYTDGGMMANNPCVIALEEGQLLWKDQQCDLLTVIGTGNFPQTNTIKGTKSLFDMSVDLITDCEAKTKAAKKMLKPTSLLSDLNTDFDMPIGLSDVASLPILIDEARSQAKTDEDIKILSRKLLATLFYIDVEDDDNKLKCTIRSRINPLPESILKQFDLESAQFTVYINRAIMVDVQEQPYTINPFGIQLSIDVSPKLLDLTLDVKCHLQCADHSANDSSISGCPKTIIRKEHGYMKSP